MLACIGGPSTAVQLVHAALVHPNCLGGAGSWLNQIPLHITMRIQPRELQQRQLCVAEASNLAIMVNESF